MQQKILDLDMKAAARVNAAAHIGAGGTGSGGARRVVALREIRPAQPLAVTVLQFDRQDLLDVAYDAGVNTGKTTPSLSG